MIIVFLVLCVTLMTLVVLNVNERQATAINDMTSDDLDGDGEIILWTATDEWEQDSGDNVQFGYSLETK